MHHGSGPRYTDLLDEAFPTKLARFAAAVAQRYPWVDAFTPVNEPLTTARFSGLYGLWYPHGRDPLTFARCLLNQIRGVSAAMRAIREVNPAAQLVQTEDLAKTFSTPKLQYQADFENERRWMTWDLLCGRVTSDHPVAKYLTWLGIAPEELDAFMADPCPPDVLGVNHYVTSERYLDDNLGAHPPESHGGNGRDRYADVAAVRVRAEGLCGPKQLLREACERYRLPVAITEAHLGCTREEQLRWFVEVWESAQALQRDGFDVRAVTAWSLFGAHDWDSLLTRNDGTYESGAFDLSSGAPRETAVAHLLRSVAAGGEFKHPALSAPGWWRRPTRLAHRVAREAETFVQHDDRPLLIVGHDDGIADGFQHAAWHRALPSRLLVGEEFQRLCEPAIAEIFATLKPWAVIYCSGVANGDETEEDRPTRFEEMVFTPQRLAAACARDGIPFVTFSSDQIFSGRQRAPYCERDELQPLNVFGELKAEMERAVFAANSRTLIVRTGEIFGTGRPDDFVATALWTLDDGRRVEAGNDLWFSVSYLPDLVSAVLDLLLDGEGGVWHLAHAGVVTSTELAIAAANVAGLDATLIAGVPTWSFNLRAARPTYRALTTTRGELLPTLESALRHYVGVALAGRDAPRRFSVCS